MSTNESGIKNWSTTTDDNNSSSPDGAPEDTPPSSINDIFREQMADNKTQWLDAQWFVDGEEVISLIDSTRFRVSGDERARYSSGRRVKIFDTSTLYADVTTSNFALNTQVTVVLDSGTMTSSISAVGVSSITENNTAFPYLAYQPVNIEDGSVNTDKISDNAVTLSKIQSSTGTLITYDVSGTATVVTSSATFQGLVTNGGGSLPTFEANPDMSPVLLLSRTITSGTSEVQLTSFVDSLEYINYSVHFNDFKHGFTSGAIFLSRLLVNSNAVTNFSYATDGIISDGNRDTDVKEDGVAFQPLGSQLVDIDVGVSGEIFYFSPANSDQTRITWNVTSTLASGEIANYSGASIHRSSTSIDGLSFLFFAGVEITGGNFHVYGYR